MAIPNSKRINQITEGKEKKTERQFKKRGYNSKKLDKNNKNKRPDFLFSKTQDSIIVEVKCIISSGRGAEGEILSILDPDNYNKIVSYSTPIDLLENKLRKASDQYLDFINDHPNHQKTPFAVAIFDESRMCPIPSILYDDFFGLNDISAVIMPEINRERFQKLNSLSKDEFNKYLNYEKFKVGPHTFEWLVIKNPEAKNPGDLYLFDPCVEPDWA